MFITYSTAQPVSFSFWIYQPSLKWLKEVHNNDETVVHYPTTWWQNWG